MQSTIQQVGASPSRSRSSILFVVVMVILGVVVFPQPVCSDGIDKLDAALFGSWRWIGAETPAGDLDPLPEQDYLLTFGSEGSLRMELEINHVNTSYAADGRRLTVRSPMMATMAAWMPDSPAPRFLVLMENTANYFFRDGILHVDTFADGGILRFERIE